ncbi:hypothetical protein [Streptomyces sp. NPDC056192]|uniref:hypothetical protein n=1 Tax=unclassified Streptomyces TaxID=2593676 RepID=UPI0035D9E26B
MDDETAAQVRGGTYQEPAGVVTRLLYAMDKPVIAAVRCGRCRSHDAAARRQLIAASGQTRVQLVPEA